MKGLTHILSAMLFLSISINSKAQPSVLNLTRNDSIVVENESGVPFGLAWAGGLNSAEISHIDLNGDGIQDLFVFDKDGNKISTFINLNKPSGDYDTYEYAPKYEKMFPPISNWCLLRDYNNDGKADIFANVPGGVEVYENITPAGLNQNLRFKLITPMLLSDYHTGNPVNIYISSQDIPVIDDLDGDGDLDILTFGVFGTLLEYHRNMSMEDYGTDDSLNYVEENECWGHFGENPNNNQITLYDTCQYNVTNPERTGKMPHNKRHIGSTTLALQMDNDSAMDLVIGDVTFPNLTYLENDTNIGIPNQNTSMIFQDTLFPENNNSTIPVDIDYFPACFYLDVNNDGAKDFIASPNVTGFNAGNNFHSVWLYKNIGSNAHPNFKIATKGFLQEEMIDVGQGASPCLADINGDGLLDMIVGNYIYHDSSGAQLAYFKNIGTNTNPKFKLMSRNFGNINGIMLNTITNQPALGLSPTIADINDDGVLDMLVGDAEGKIHWFTIDSTGITLQQVNYDSIDVGQYACPQLVDINGDGLLDLVIGNMDGHIYYYQNTGTATNPHFTLITDHLGNVDTAPWWGYYGYCSPYFYRINNKLKLLCGTHSGYLYYYTDIDSNLNGTFTRTDTTYLGLYGGYYIKIAGGDFINNDTVPDILIGQYGGGLTAWSGSLIDSLPQDSTPNWTGVENNRSKDIFNIYPNPANDELFIKYPPHPINKIIYLEIYSMLGKRIMKKQVEPSCKINIESIPNGIYVVGLHSKSGKLLNVRKIVIQHR